MAQRWTGWASLLASLVLLAACEGAGGSDPDASGSNGSATPTRTTVAAEPEAEAHRLRGYEAIERGEWSVAIAEYTRAIELDPTARDYEERAYAHGWSDDPLAAIADYTRAIELDPQSARAFNQRALEYNNLGRWTEAIDDLDRAIELRPDRADQYNGRAFAHINLGNWDQAVADTTRALELADADDPIIPIYLSNRASAYWELGELALALADLDRSIALDPGNLTSHFDRIGLLIELDRAGEARAAASELVADQGWPPVAAHVLLADAFAALERFEDAVRELDVALELDPR